VTTPPLLTIGAFARSVGLTPSALRHYDECGLLVPAEVDDATGYRYYTPLSAERARLIGRMRDVGVSIPTMRRILDGPDEDAGRLLAELADERAADAARAQTVLREVLAAVAAGPRSEIGHVRLDGPVLAAAIRQVRAAADGDAGTALGAVLVDVSAASVDVVATNRYWMAVRSVPSHDSAGEGRAVLGLAEAALTADRLDHLGEATIEIADGRLRIADDGHGPVGRSTPYPAHRLLIAGLAEARTIAQVDRGDLSEAIGHIGRAEVVLRLEEGGLSVAGEGVSAIEVAGVARGPEVAVRMGSALLRRALGSCLGVDVRLAVSGDRDAVRLDSPYQPGFLALVMPSPA